MIPIAIGLFFLAVLFYSGSYWFEKAVGVLAMGTSLIFSMLFFIGGVVTLMRIL